MTAEQRPVVDDLGNIAVHGRSGLVLVVKIETATAGVYEDISASDLFFEIGGKLRLALSAGADIYSRQVILTRAQIATLSINQPYAFAIHDETPSTPSTPWTGTITTFGFKAAPTGVPDVDGEAANWTGATVVIQPGGGSPVVVVNYMGQPGAAGAAGVGIPTGGTTGQYLRKSSSTDYATGWDTLTADDVSGLSSTLSTLTSADVSLTTRLSTEETTRASADTSLTTRVSTEEATRSSADTSLATAVAATYLPLAGGVMTGALAAVAGTAALPGLAVAGDLDTGMWSPAGDTLAWSTAGTEKLRLTTGGLLGLGVVPTSFLHVAGATGATLNTTYEPTGWAGLKHRVGVQYSGDTLVSSVNVRLTSLSAGTLDDATQPGSALVLRGDGALTLVDTTAGAGVRTFAPMFGVSGTGVTTLYNNLLFGTDNTYDIGAVSATRPRNIHAGTSLNAPEIYAGPTGLFGVNSRLQLKSPSDGVAQLTNWAGTDFTRLQFGGTTSAFPAWGRSGTQLRALLADGSGYAPIRASYYAFSGGQLIDSNSTDQFIFQNNGATALAYLAVEANNTLALRNGVNAQTLRAYNTYTDASNYERVSLDWSANIAYLRTQKGGTGADRSIVISATASAYIGGGGSFQWQFSSDGNFYPNADATTDAGGAAKQIRDLYLSRRLMIGGAAPAGASGLATVQGFGTNWSLIGSNTLTDATGKNNIIGTLHYLSAQPPVISIYAASSGAENTLNFGGGSATGNAATLLNFYTAAGLTTPTGTIRWSMNTNGHFLAAADNTYDIGASGASRPRIAYIGTRVVAPTVTTTATTVASLPAAATAGAGGRAFVTDATATTFLSVVAGGGANAVPVVSNGTNWLIG